MSEAPGEGKPANNVYTIMMLVAVLYMAAGTIFLAMRCQQLFGTWNPFSATVS